MEWANANSGLYWVLSDGGGGSYGVVWSLTSKAYVDIPDSGANLAVSSEGVAKEPPLLGSTVNLYRSIPFHLYLQYEKQSAALQLCQARSSACLRSTAAMSAVCPCSSSNVNRRLEDIGLEERKKKSERRRMDHKGLKG